MILFACYFVQLTHDVCAWWCLQQQEEAALMLLGRMNGPEAINVTNSQQKTYDTMLSPCSIAVSDVLLF